MAIWSDSFTLLWPTNSSRREGRSAASVTRSSGSASGVVIWVRPAGFMATARAFPPRRQSRGLLSQRPRAPGHGPGVGFELVARVARETLVHRAPRAVRDEPPVGRAAARADPCSGGCHCPLWVSSCSARRTSASVSAPPSAASTSRSARSASAVPYPSRSSALRAASAVPSLGAAPPSGSSNSPSLSASSSARRSAVFLPMPLTDARRPMFRSRTARAPRSTPSADISAIAIFGPMPVTPMSRWKNRRPAASRKPYSAQPSSRTTSSVARLTLSPTGGSRSITPSGTAISYPTPPAVWTTTRSACLAARRPLTWAIIRGSPAEDVRERDRHAVRRVRGRRGLLQLEEPGHHRADLGLGRAARPDDRLLHGRRRVLRDREPCFFRGQQDHAPGVPQDERRLHVLVVEGVLERP